MEDLQGERVREGEERSGFQSAGNPVYIYIIISTLTPSSSSSLSYAFSRGGGLLACLLSWLPRFFLFFSHFLKSAASVGENASSFLICCQHLQPLLNSVFLPHYVLFRRDFSDPPPPNPLVWLVQMKRRQ